MGGINKLLYGEKEPETLWTQKQIMERLQIKDARTLKRIIKNEDFPHIIIEGKIYTTPSQYEKWINKKFINKY